jgi:PAS domain S-box-containing protein
MAPSKSTNPYRFEREITIVPERGGDALTRVLAESEERFRRLVHRVEVGVFRASSDGHFVEGNPALARMLGYAHEAELYDLTIARDVFVDSAECERLRARLARGPVERVSTRWKRRDGTCLTVRLSLRTIEGEDGDMQLDGIVEDLTERLRQQDALRRTERMACLGATLAGVAHELNNPLAAILGFAQLLLRKEMDEEARLALETIDHEAARAGRIVRDLLTLARKPEAERRARVNLNDVVGYIVGTRRYALETHGIACRSALDPMLPPVAGDRAQLEQVVLNLLNNAEQAIRSSGGDAGQVSIRTRVDGAAVVLEIEDDGPGIPDETRDQIWEPFWTTKALGSGTGLGLTVVRDIVASHGGEIAVTRSSGAAQGAGARFVVRLPALAHRGEPATDPVETASRALDVLVIDANYQSAGFLTAFLSSRGHAALAAQNVEYALRLAEHLTFDAVICDSSLAAGKVVLGALRSAAGCADARFIVAAGDAASTARLPFPLPAATALVMRPYDLEELRILLED